MCFAPSLLSSAIAWPRRNRAAKAMRVCLGRPEAVHIDHETTHGALYTGFVPIGR